NVFAGLFIALLPQGDDFRRFTFLMIEVFVKPCKPTTGKIILNATVLPTAAAGQGKITPDHLQRIHRQADMAELTGNITATGNRLAVNDNPTAAARSQNKPHD